RARPEQVAPTAAEASGRAISSRIYRHAKSTREASMLLIRAQANPLVEPQAICTPRNFRSPDSSSGGHNKSWYASQRPRKYFITRTGSVLGGISARQNPLNRASFRLRNNLWNGYSSRNKSR